METPYTHKPEILYNTKIKIQNLLHILIEKYNITQFISDKDGYTIDYNKLNNDKTFAIYKEEQKYYGHISVGDSLFEKYIGEVYPNYFIVYEIYKELCETGTILTEYIDALEHIYSNIGDKK